MSNEKTGVRTALLMQHVDECIEAALSCNRAHFEGHEWVEYEDQRRHYAATWCAVRDMIALEVEDKERRPVAFAWFHRGMVNFDEEATLKELDDGKGTPIPLYAAGAENKPEEVEWVEAEESVRGSRLRDVLTNPSVTVIWHSSKPKTSNPVWEVRGNLFTAIR